MITRLLAWELLIRHAAIQVKAGGETYAFASAFRARTGPLDHALIAEFSMPTLPGSRPVLSDAPSKKSRMPTYFQLDATRIQCTLSGKGHVSSQDMSGLW